MGDKFQYQLESLLKKRQLEQDVASAEEAAARELVNQKREQADVIEGTILAAEDELRGQYTEGKELDRERQVLLSTYITHQRKALEQKRVELVKATNAHEETLRKLEETRCGVKTLEKHREGRYAEFMTERDRAEQNLIDELWLLRGQGADE